MRNYVEKQTIFFLAGKLIARKVIVLPTAVCIYINDFLISLYIIHYLTGERLTNTTDFQRMMCSFSHYKSNALISPWVSSTATMQISTGLFRFEYLSEELWYLFISRDKTNSANVNYSSDSAPQILVRTRTTRGTRIYDSVLYIRTTVYLCVYCTEDRLGSNFTSAFDFIFTRPSIKPRNAAD